MGAAGQLIFKGKKAVQIESYIEQPPEFQDDSGDEASDSDDP